MNEITNLQVTLYQFQSTYIKITQVLHFDKDDLIFEGYDIGLQVKDWWGDSDYEYDFRIPKEEVAKMFEYFKIIPADKEGLLLVLSEKFQGNFAYRDLCSFMDKNGIEYEGVNY